MEPLFEQFLKEILSQTLGEGSRWMKRGALSLALHTISFFRRLTLLNQIANVLTLMISLSLFWFILSFAKSWPIQKITDLNQDAIISGSIFVFCLIFWILAFAESTWIKASGIHELIDESPKNKFNSQNQNASPISPEQLAEIVSSVVDAKLKLVKSEKNEQTADNNTVSEDDAYYNAS